jgi:TolA-binding protein
MPEMSSEIRRVEKAQEQARHDERWRSLRVADVAAVDDLEAYLKGLRGFLHEFPETPHATAALDQIAKTESRLRDRLSRVERGEIDSFSRAAGSPGADPRGVLDQIDGFLRDHAESVYRSEALELRAELIRRIDDSDIERARSLEREQPSNFAARRQRFQEYLKIHSTGGRHVAEALDAIERADRERETHLYRVAFDHARAHPDDVATVAAHLREYLEIYPNGHHAADAKVYIEWWERISNPNDYTVTLRSAEIDPAVTKVLAGAGPNLSVELWVNGIKYGPSPIVPDSAQPIWDYTFARKIRWRMGEPVVIRIIDNDWGQSYIQRFESRPDDKLAMKLLAGKIAAAKGGKNSITFRSDFAIPTLPAPRGAGSE